MDKTFQLILEIIRMDKKATPNYMMSRKETIYFFH